MMRYRWTYCAAALVIAAAACGRASLSDAGGPTGGTVIVSSPADADAILPALLRTTVGKMVADLIFEPLAQIGDSLNVVGDAGFTPRLAQRWTWSPDSASIAFALDPNAKWQDGAPVRAADVKFSFELLTDPAIGSIVASSLTEVDSVTTPDSMTAVAWFKRRSPEQFFTLVYNLTVMPQHRLAKLSRDQLAGSAEATQPVGSGRFRLVRWERSSMIELEADTANYRGRPLLDRVIVSVAPDPTAATTRLLAGEADFIEVLRGDAVERIKNNAHATAMNYAGYDYGTVMWNVRDPGNEGRPHPILGDRMLRLALAMAVNRDAVVKSVLDTLGVVSNGPFVRAQSFADAAAKAPAYDPAAARALLDSLGWRDTNGDGFRERGGRPLELTLVVPVSSLTRMRMSVLLQDQLKSSGVRLKLDQVEPNVFAERAFATRRWDGLFMGWRPDPGSTGISQIWAARNAKPGGSNLSRYANAEFDAHMDSAQTTHDLAARRAHFHQAFTILNADSPAIWLYELRSAVGINKRIRPGRLRPDAWWAHMDEWSIPTELRL
ncbi:MAG: peptide ABC transporter substrate-binding protein, partial [Gemmatimonadaceae bacterium]